MNETSGCYAISAKSVRRNQFLSSIYERYSLECNFWAWKLIFVIVMWKVWRKRVWWTLIMGDSLWEIGRRTVWIEIAWEYIGWLEVLEVLEIDDFGRQNPIFDSNRPINFKPSKLPSKLPSLHSRPTKFSRFSRHNWIIYDVCSLKSLVHLVSEQNS
jgi:hypothetical protein